MARLLIETWLVVGAGALEQPVKNSAAIAEVVSSLCIIRIGVWLNTPRLTDSFWRVYHFLLITRIYVFDT